MECGSFVIIDICSPFSSSSFSILFFVNQRVDEIMERTRPKEVEADLQVSMLFVVRSV